MWIEQNNKLNCEYQFADFKTAFTFMTKVATVAEAQGHHPCWTNVYNRVKIELCTHEAGNVVTEKDERLAEAIEDIFNEM